MIAYSKSNEVALGYDYLVSQMINSVIYVKFSVWMFIWCWVDNMIKNWVKIKATKQKPLVLNLDGLSWTS